MRLYLCVKRGDNNSLNVIRVEGEPTISDADLKRLKSAGWMVVTVKYPDSNDHEVDNQEDLNDLVNGWLLK